ncbi:DOMON domain-containing protein FRRS1L-like isoform X2 [Mizuhopecten yessoensis]|nr:DOMON domain-containing protein FRRS1L-like isoform X2 [Mizuhopecten yessoensis]
MSWTKLICILIASVFTQLTNGEIPPDSQCGKAKICWPAECPAEGCVGFLISWWNTDLDYLRFEMKMEIVPSGEHYIALGFSGNNQMPDSSIVMCRSDDNVQLGYTQGRTYAPGTDLYGIRNTSFADTNNITTCSFDRIKKPTKNEDTLRSLTDSFFLIRAWGAVTGGVPAYHKNNRGVSPKSYSYPVMKGTGHNIKPASVSLCACLIGAWLSYMLH